MKSVEDLDVYRLAFELTLRVYKITETFPKSELFGLVSQMRRAAVSINSNLSEGSARGTSGEYKQFVGIARGSTAELAYQIKIATALGFIDDKESVYLCEAVDRVGKMLSKLMEKIGNIQRSRITNTSHETC